MSPKYRSYYEKYMNKLYNELVNSFKTYTLTEMITKLKDKHKVILNNCIKYISVVINDILLKKKVLINIDNLTEIYKFYYVSCSSVSKRVGMHHY